MRLMSIRHATLFTTLLSIEIIEMIKELKNMFFAQARMMEIIEVSRELTRLNIGVSKHNRPGMTIKKTTGFKA